MPSSSGEQRVCPTAARPNAIAVRICHWVHAVQNKNQALDTSMSQVASTEFCHS